MQTAEKKNYGAVIYIIYICISVYKCIKFFRYKHIINIISYPSISNNKEFILELGTTLRMTLPTQMHLTKFIFLVSKTTTVKLISGYSLWVLEVILCKVNGQKLRLVQIFTVMLESSTDI